MPAINGQFHSEMRFRIQCAECQISIQNINFRRKLKVTCKKNSFFSHIYADFDWEFRFFISDETDFFKFRIMSVTSSRTPGTVENSCSTPSILIDVIATPSKDESNTRRRLLPSVIPYPRSSGRIRTCRNARQHSFPQS